MNDKVDADCHEDIFGKIDALLGKRVGFASGAKTKEAWDFPLLTDIVEPQSEDEGPMQPEGMPHEPEVDNSQLALDSHSAPHQDNEAKFSVEWVTGGAPELPLEQAEEEIIPMQQEEIEEPQVSAEISYLSDLETRLSTLLAEHEARMEAKLRQTVREELERLLGRA